MTDNPHCNPKYGNNDPELSKTVSEKDHPSIYRDPEKGENLGTGTCLEKLGEGGMGRVYRIWSTKFEMDRAVKIIPDSANPVTAQRFVREAKMTIQLDHPNIVRVYDYNTWKNFHFIEMEFVRGQTLDAILKQDGPFDILSTLAIGIITCKTLQHAHTHIIRVEGEQCKGLVHRDLKPGNIMLSDAGTVKLMDFGIARPIGEAIATITSGPIGTYSYMSPEQLENSKINPRGDIYSLGAVLYELLTGTIAFTSDSFNKLLHNKMHGVYKPIQETVPAVPEQLVSIIDKSLKVRPEDRYMDAAAFADDLELVFKALSNDSPEQVLKKKVAGLSVAENTPDKLSKVKTASQMSALKPLLKTVFFMITGVLLMAGLSIALFNPFRSGGSVAAATPELLSPVNNKEIAEPRVRCIWHPTGPNDSYLLQVALQEDFLDSIVVNDFFSDTVAIIALTATGRYFWRIRKRGDEMKWSEIASFIFSGIPSLPPSPVSPPQSSMQSTDSVTCRWSVSGRSCRFRFQLSKTESFSVTINDSILADTVIAIKKLENNTVYFWRTGIVVQENDTPRWSEASQFTIAVAAKEVLADTGAALQKKYGTDDLQEIARSAIGRNNFSDALWALFRMVPSNLKDSLSLRLVEASLNKNRPDFAKKVLDRLNSTDGFAYLCRGRIFAHSHYGQYEKAFGAFKRAEDSPTLFDDKEVDRQALYLYAMAFDAFYRNNPTPDNNEKAKNAWLDVVRFCKKNKFSNDTCLISAINRSNAIAKEILSGKQ